MRNIIYRLLKRRAHHITNPNKYYYLKMKHLRDNTAFAKTIPLDTIAEWYLDSKPDDATVYFDMEATEPMLETICRLPTVRLPKEVS